MEWSEAQRRWSQLKGQLRIDLPKITREDFAEIDGNRERLVAKIEERYGEPRARAEQRADAWLHRLTLPAESALR